MAVDQATYAHITTATTTVLNPRQGGILKRLVVNTGGAGSTATIYDNNAGSGTVIAVVATAAQGVFNYDCQYSLGLTVVTAAGTPADITVVYV